MGCDLHDSHSYIDERTGRPYGEPDTDMYDSGYEEEDYEEEEEEEEEGEDELEDWESELELWYDEH